VDIPVLFPNPFVKVFLKLFVDDKLIGGCAPLFFDYDICDDRGISFIEALFTGVP